MRSSCRSETTATLFTPAAFEAPYENENSFGPTYGAHREALELGRDDYVELQALRARTGADVLRDAFDVTSADLLAELDVPAFKIASGDLQNTPLLRHVAAFGKPICSRPAARRSRTSTARSRRSCR